MSVSKTMKALAARWIEAAIQRCQRWSLDIFRDPMVPPTEAIFVGGFQFAKVGNRFLELFKEYGGLLPSSHVLDVGSGQGRMALPLTRFLSPSAQYVGIEVVREGVDWCEEKYRRFCNFRFIHADIFNKNYNPGGSIAASQYRFPFESESFDFVFLTSVFTHMCPDDFQHYLSEIARCLKTGGRCFITFFLLNEVSLDAIRSGRSTLPFHYQVFDQCLTVNADTVEAAIAYPEEFVLDAYRRNGLSLVGDIHYGRWIPRETSLCYQDVIVGVKTTA